MPGWIYRWIDRRGRIPRWVRWAWPYIHFCPELDDMLVEGGEMRDVGCDICDEALILEPRKSEAVMVIEGEEILRRALDDFRKGRAEVPR